uniref:Uncharacterized protein n=1 Tax=Phytophthora fragariae TaxID=53985 RepID=A0A6A3EVD1_9STRA|nr:hypothetical protein PF009_g16038 [Phytophthora fragariae]
MLYRKSWKASVTGGTSHRGIKRTIMSPGSVCTPCEALNESLESPFAPRTRPSGGRNPVMSLSSSSSSSPWGVDSIAYDSFGCLGVGMVSEYEAGSGGGSAGEDS